MPSLLLFLAVSIWGGTFVATRILVPVLSPVEILALRCFVGLPVLGMVLLWRRIPLRLDREDLGPILGGSAIFTAHFLLQIQGLETTTASNTGWLIAVTPLALAILAFLLLGERLGRGVVAGIAVASVGIVILVSRGDLANLGGLRSIGDWLVLGSAFTWALYTITTRDLVRRRHPLTVTFAVLAVATLAVGVLFVWRADVDGIRHLDSAGLAALFYLGIPGTALAHWFWQEGVAAVGAARAGLFLYLEPLATVAFAVPLLGEPVGGFLVLGGGLVLGGVWLGQSFPSTLEVTQPLLQAGEEDHAQGAGESADRTLRRHARMRERTRRGRRVR